MHMDTSLAAEKYIVIVGSQKAAIHKVNHKFSYENESPACHYSELACSTLSIQSFYINTRWRQVSLSAWLMASHSFTAVLLQRSSPPLCLLKHHMLHIQNR